MLSFFSQETSGPDVSPSEKLEKVIQLAELCIELIQQNEEHHAEVVTFYHLWPSISFPSFGA